VRVTFDPNLSEERCISVSKAFLEKEPVGVAPELVKDYDIVLLRDGREQARQAVRGNYHRLNVWNFSSVVADTVEIRILATNGAADARVFEVRVY